MPGALPGLPTHLAGGQEAALVTCRCQRTTRRPALSGLPALPHLGTLSWKNSEATTNVIRRKQMPSVDKALTGASAPLELLPARLPPLPQQGNESYPWTSPGGATVSALRVGSVRKPEALKGRLRLGAEPGTCGATRQRLQHTPGLLGADDFQRLDRPQGL